MSDPVTNNVEIEDVLTSIRRLVAQGDKPRDVVDVQKNDAAAPVVQPDRFVLTPALRVAHDKGDSVVAQTPTAKPAVFGLVAPAAEPLVLTPADAMQEPLLHDDMSDAERASLEATIAELEAAVTAQPDDWEPDGSEMSPSTGLADALAAMHDDADIHDAKIVDTDPIVTLHPIREEPTFRHVAADDADTDYGDELRESDDDGVRIPDDLDETLAGYIAGGSKLEREEMRKMIVDVVRQNCRVIWVNV